MKKSKAFIIGAIALATMSFTAATINPLEKAAQVVSEQILTTAVNSGYISAADKQTVLESGIVEEVAQTFVETNYDVPATVDKSAEAMVERGWFKNKETAKKALRKACEQARNNSTIAKQAYKWMGI